MAKRIDADLAMLIGLDGKVIADTVGGAVGTAFTHPKLLAAAESEQQASALVVLNDRLYQVVLVPVLVAVAGGVGRDRIPRQRSGCQHPARADALSRIAVQPSQRQAAGGCRQARSTPRSASSRCSDLERDRFAAVDATGNATYDAVALTRVLRLPAGAGDSVVVLLQEPLAAAMEPFYRLQRQLGLISLIAVIVSIIASVLIARGIVRPVHDLVATARRIAAGDYAALPPPSRNDEIGDLASAVRTMGEDIASRESRIMDLAYRDPLTRLPNRAMFAARAGSRRSRGAPRPGRSPCC